MKRATLALSVFLFANVSALAKDVFTNEGFFVEDKTKASLKSILSKPGTSVDHVSSRGYEIFGPLGTAAILAGLGVNAKPLVGANPDVAAQYPTPAEIERQLKELAQRSPQLTQLFSIGKSQDNRELWMMRLSRAVGNPALDLPKVKYVANMHGDEIVGREMMMRLIRDLIEKDGVDAQITNLLSTSDIYIMPSMNPDGAAARRRGNAYYIDLNRNFPDFTTMDDEDTPDGRAPETKAMMAFQRQHKFVLSANFHGGAEVVCYPFDTKGGATPDEAWFKNIALLYASLVPYISSSTEFEKGIVRGFDWYEVNGGMQDWSYHWHGDKQITVELSGVKWPEYSEIEEYYTENRAALLGFLGEGTKSSNLQK